MNHQNTCDNMQKSERTALLVAAFLALLTGTFISFSYRLLAIEIAFIFVLVVLIFLARNFTPIILLLLVLRPIVDVWSDYRIDFIGIQMVMTVSVIASSVFYLIAHKKNKYINIIIKDPFFILFVIYLFFNSLSIAVNPKVAVNDSLSLFFRFASFLAMYVWGILLFRSQQKRDWVIASYVVASFFICLVGYYQLATGQFHAERGVLAIRATFSHPNMFANFLILANLACIYFILKKKYIYINSFLLIINLFLFSQTYSRMALAVWLLLLFVLAISYRKYALYFMPLLILFVLAIFYKYSNVVDFWFYRFSTIHDVDKVVNDRSYIFIVLINLFKENPLFGIGPATFCPYYYPFAQPHNEFLRNLAEVGLAGTLPFFLMWGLIIKRFFSTNYFVKITKENHQKFFIFLMIISVVLISLTSNIGTKPELLWPLFVLFGSYVVSDDNDIP